MNTFFEWPILWRFPVLLFVLALILILGVTVGVRSKKLARQEVLLLGLTIAIFAGVGVHHAYIAAAPRVEQTQLIYSEEIQEHISFSTKYHFTDETGKQYFLRFPYLSSNETVVPGSLVPGQKYDVTYESQKDILLHAKSAFEAIRVVRKDVTGNYVDDGTHFSNLGVIKKRAILPLSISVITMLAGILLSINSETVRGKCGILFVTVIILSLSTYQGVRYIIMASHPVIVEEETSLVMVNEESRSENVELDFVSDDGVRHRFFPARNTIEQYLDVIELPYCSYIIVYEEQSNTLLDVKINETDNSK